MPESNVTTKGQTTLHKDDRRALKLQPCDKLRYLILDDGEVRIARCQPVMGLAGLLKQPGGPVVSLDDMDEAIARGARDA